MPKEKIKEELEKIAKWAERPKESMNRAIKFRQEDNKQNPKTWHYWGFIDERFIPPIVNLGGGQSYQFTGLLDKNREMNKPAPYWLSTLSAFSVALFLLILSFVIVNSGGAYIIIGILVNSFGSIMLYVFLVGVSKCWKYGLRATPDSVKEKQNEKN